VFDRVGSIPSMNSRIVTLLTTFKLESRQAKEIRNNNQFFDVNYSHVPPLLAKERKRAFDYLKKSLNVYEKV